MRVFPDAFAGLLEDARGGGRQYLVGAEGQAHALMHAGDAEAFLSAWSASLKQSRQDDNPVIRFLIYAAYEAASMVESLPDPKTAVPGPLLWVHEAACGMMFDVAQGVWHLSAPDEAGLDQLQAMLEGSIDEVAETTPLPVCEVQGTASEHYQNAVLRVRDYIAAGDVFQANIARFWQAKVASGDLLDLYTCLRRVNPAPFACWLRVVSDEHEPLTLISASPERLVSMSSDGGVGTRPIAGTRRRAEGEDDDAALSAELLLSEKERAEHIMLVDLERNDLGRVCVPGSVHVDECMVIERYATVQHIVSNVQGKLAPGMDFVDLFKAMFPGGTITGCPKVRCMEIIHEMEEQARGPYTGGVGYVAWDGSADMNILIRTFWHYQDKLHWAAGAGIVADSDPEAECIETEHKAAGLLRALSI